MLTVKGVYDQGKIKLSQDVKFKKVTNVLITFPEDSDTEEIAPLKKATYSFKKSRQLLKDYKGSLSQAVVEERRRFV